VLCGSLGTHSRDIGEIPIGVIPNKAPNTDVVGNKLSTFCQYLENSTRDFYDCRAVVETCVLP